MIVELVLRELPNLELEGYEKIEVPVGILFANPIEKRVDIIVKKHPDGRVSVFTDKADVVKKILEKAEVVDIHAK
jgi:hypothetical protein